jgi:hypothetical protein
MNDINSKYTIILTLPQGLLSQNTEILIQFIWISVDLPAVHICPTPSKIKSWLEFNSRPGKYGKTSLNSNCQLLKLSRVQIIIMLLFFRTFYVHKTVAFLTKKNVFSMTFLKIRKFFYKIKSILQERGLVHQH